MQNMERKSELNSTFEITTEKWVLTLARKTNGVHTQHAFFIIEGIDEEGAAAIWFIDLVGNPLLPNLNKSKLRIYPYTEKSEENLKITPLIFRCDHCRKGMLKLDEHSEIASKQWWISKDKALCLIKTIEQEKINPPIFNILGYSSALTASSAVSSSKEKGHSCFSWCKEKITDLNDSSISIKETDLAQWINKIANITSLALPYKNKSKSNYAAFWKAESTITNAATLAVGIGICAVAVMAFKR